MHPTCQVANILSPSFSPMSDTLDYNANMSNIKLICTKKIQHIVQSRAASVTFDPEFYFHVFFQVQDLTLEYIEEVEIAIANSLLVQELYYSDIQLRKHFIEAACHKDKSTRTAATLQQWYHIIIWSTRQTLIIQLMLQWLTLLTLLTLNTDIITYEINLQTITALNITQEK